MKFAFCMSAKPFDLPKSNYGSTLNTLITFISLKLCGFVSPHAKFMARLAPPPTCPPSLEPGLRLVNFTLCFWPLALVYVHINEPVHLFQS